MINDILWEIFEIAVNFFQGFILTYFAYAYLGDKEGRKFAESPAMIYSVILAIVISVVNQLTVFEHFLLFVYIIIILIYIFTSLCGSYLQKIFSALFPSVIITIVSSFAANFAAIIFKTDLYLILSSNNIERFISVIATQLFILYSVILVLKLLNSHKNNGGLVVTEWVLISIVLLISITIGALINFIALDPTSRNGRIYIAVVFAGVILINIVVCYLVIDLGKKNIAVRENEALKLAQEYSRQYAKNAKIEYDVLRKLRHDFKDNFSVIYTLMKNNNVELAMKHIEKNVGALSETEIFIQTNNDIVNAVINAKLSTAKSLGIDSTCLSVMDFDGIDDLDLCRLLSNMLENSITACISIKEGEKRIYLKITDDEYNYMFNLKNTIESSVIENNRNLETTKSEKELHGFGTQIIKDISLKYNGRCDFYEEEGCFCCNVVLSK